MSTCMKCGKYFSVTKQTDYCPTCEASNITNTGKITYGTSTYVNDDVPEYMKFIYNTTTNNEEKE